MCVVQPFTLKLQECQLSELLGAWHFTASPQHSQLCTPGTDMCLLPTPAIAHLGMGSFCCSIQECTQSQGSQPLGAEEQILQEGIASSPLATSFPPEILGLAAPGNRIAEKHSNMVLSWFCRLQCRSCGHGLWEGGWDAAEGCRQIYGS